MQAFLQNLRSGEAGESPAQERLAALRDFDLKALARVGVLFSREKREAALYERVRLG